MGCHVSPAGGVRTIEVDPNVR